MSSTSEGTCEVSIGGYDGDGPETFHAVTVKARKLHRCVECPEPILPGQRYVRVSGKWEGDWATFRFCLPCDEVVQEFSEAHVFGTLWGEMEQNWERGAHLQACLNRLKTVAAKERMRNRWMRWKGLADELTAP